MMGIADAIARNGAIGTRYIGFGCSDAPGVVPVLISMKSRPRSAGTKSLSTAKSLLPVADIPSMCQTSNTVASASGKRNQRALVRSVVSTARPIAQSACITPVP